MYRDSKPVSLEIVILAAGSGRRMQSALPKVLHRIGGKPMLAHVLETAEALRPSAIHIVEGSEGALLHEAFPKHMSWVKQERPEGTGHAVQCALPYIHEEARVLVLYGDVPLITQDTLKCLIEKTPDALGALLVNMPNPQGFGRVIRNKEGFIMDVVEERDLKDAQKQISDIFTGILLAPKALLATYLPTLDNHNAQQEYYLTQLFSKVAASQQYPIVEMHTENLFEVAGVNDLFQLNVLERHYQERQAKKLLQAGVTLMDYRRFDLRGTIDAAPNVTIDVDVIFEGTNTVGQGSRIGPYCLIKNATIGENVIIHAHSVIDGAEIESFCQVGPFARLRKGTHLKSYAKIGNFVETKKSTIGSSSKVNHLSYIGDAHIGSDVNIGAGTITCNYDGVHKYPTFIEDGAFIGSGTQLVAPMRVGKNATIGAGTTLRKDAPADTLTCNDTRQRSLPGWKRTVKPLPE